MVFLLECSGGVGTFAGYRSIDPRLLLFATTMVRQDGLVAGLFDLNKAGIVHCFSTRSDSKIPRLGDLEALAQVQILAIGCVGEEFWSIIDQSEWSGLVIATQACCVDNRMAYSGGDEMVPGLFVLALDADLELPLLGFGLQDIRVEEEAVLRLDARKVPAFCLELSFATQRVLTD